MSEEFLILGERRAVLVFWVTTAVFGSSVPVRIPAVLPSLFALKGEPTAQRYFGPKWLVL